MNTTRVLSIQEVKGQIAGMVIGVAIGLSVFSIIALLVFRTDGVIRFIGFIFLGLGLGSLGMVCCCVYRIFESMWIIRKIRQGSNPYSESQVHLRLGIQNLVLACLTLTVTILLYVWLIKFYFSADVLLYSIVLGIVPCMVVYFYGKEALQMFRDAGRFEERERIERERGL